MCGVGFLCVEDVGMRDVKSLEFGQVHVLRSDVPICLLPELSRRIIVAWKAS